MKVPEPIKLPSGTWYIRMRLNGENVNVSASTKRECVNRAQLIKAEHRAGKRTERQHRTLGQAMDIYIDDRKNVLSPSTIRGYRAYRRSRFTKYMGRQLDGIDWQRAVNEESKLCSPKTMKNAWGLVKSVLAENGISVSVRLPAPVPTKKEWLAPEQIPTFIESVQNEPCEIGALLALSGLRRSEIYGLDWNDVDIKRKTIHIHQSMVLGEDAKPVTRGQNKTQSSTRDVPIFLDRLCDVLRASKDKTGKVVPGNIGTLRKQLKRVCENASLPDVGVHGLRHSFASLCYSLGISEKVCMELGGWSDYQTMRRIYTHVSQRDTMRGAIQLENFFKNAN